MRAKSKITFQEVYQLRSFMKNLGARRITTLEFKGVLMILRQHCDTRSALYDWTNSVAHKQRDRGITFDAGVGLWIEKFEINAYFSTDVPRLKKIPTRIFEMLLGLFRDPTFHFGGTDMKSRFPGGHSREEILASIKWMYHKSDDERVYNLISPADANAEDLDLMQFCVSQMESHDWGGPSVPF